MKNSFKNNLFKILMDFKQIIKEIRKDIFTFGLEYNINDLEIFLQKASEAYYNTGNPLINDDEFDILVDFLRKRNPKAKFLKQVGAPIKNKVKLDYYLGSMDKVKPPSTKLDNWKKKYKGPYYLSDKLDGISGLLIYNNNKINFYTRGTATEGMDITSLLKYIKIPKFQDVKNKLEQLSVKGTKNLLALRGEIIMSKSNFKKYSKEFKNGRNLVSGLVNSKNKNPIISQDLDFVVYQVIDPLFNFTNQMDLIKNLGFKQVYYQKEKEITYPVLSQILKQRKNNSKYEVDGIIVTNNDTHKLNVGKNPEFAFAFKELIEEAFKKATVKSIEWNESKSGKIVPTVIIKPIELDGVTVSRVTAFHAKYVKENGLGKGAIIEITRSGDVIPYIVKIIKKVNPDFPNKEYKWSDSGVDILTLGQTDEQTIQKIYFFFKTLETKGFGLRLIIKLYENGFDSIEKILNMKVEDFLTLENVKEKSANNFYNELNKIKNKKYNIEKLILATNSLGDNFGSRKAKLIFDAYPDILKKNILKDKKTKDYWIKNLIEIPGIEKKTAQQIINNWKNLIDNIKWLKKYFNFQSPKKPKNKPNKLKYNNWVLSGFRDKDLQDKIEDLGGKTSSTISKNTDILVVKDKSVIENPTSKVKKALDFKIKIIEKSKIMDYLK